MKPLLSNAQRRNAPKYLFSSIFYKQKKQNENIDIRNSLKRVHRIMRSVRSRDTVRKPNTDVIYTDSIAQTKPHFTVITIIIIIVLIIGHSCVFVCKRIIMANVSRGSVNVPVSVSVRITSQTDKCARIHVKRVNKHNWTNKRSDFEINNDVLAIGIIYERHASEMCRRCARIKRA